MGKIDKKKREKTGKKLMERISKKYSSLILIQKNEQKEKRTTKKSSSHLLFHVTDGPVGYEQENCVLLTRRVPAHRGGRQSCRLQGG